MKLEVFTLRMEAGSGVFDDKELAAFQTDKEVIEVSARAQITMPRF